MSDVTIPFYALSEDQQLRFYLATGRKSGFSFNIEEDAPATPTYDSQGELTSYIVYVEMIAPCGSVIPNTEFLVNCE